MPLLRLKNPLVFPGDRLPGIDQSHSASAKLQASVVPANSNNFINLCNAAPGVTHDGSSLPVGVAVRNLMGKALKFDSGGSQSVRWTAGIKINQASPYPATMAVIASISALGGGGSFQFFCENGGACNIQFGLLSNVLALNRWGASNDVTSFIPALNVPYFFAMTTDNVNTTVIVWTNLQTGQVGSFSATPASAIIQGTFIFDVIAFPSGQTLSAYIAAAMYSQALLIKGQMLAWAAAPWDFWYPPRVEQIIGLSLARSQVTPPARPSPGTWIVNQY